MSKAVRLFSIFCGYITVIVILCTWSCVTHYSDVVYCIDDVYCYVEHNSKNLIIPVFLMTLFVYNRDYLRTSYMLRFISIRKWVFSILGKQLIPIFVISLWEMVITTVSGYIASERQSTWGLYEGKPYKLTKSVAVINVPEIAVPFIFMLCTFLILLSSAILFITFWVITENAAVGYVVIVSLAIVEYIERMKLFFNVIDLDPVSVYLYGFQIDVYIKCAVLVLALAVVLCLILAKRKNYYRLH